VFSLQIKAARSFDRPSFPQPRSSEPHCFGPRLDYDLSI
jgi:hypothetical protein